MELLEYWYILRKRWVGVLLIITSSVLVAAAATSATLPQYTATTRLFFAVPGGESVSDLAQGSSFTEKQMSSYAQVATAPLVLDRVADEVGLDASAGALAGRVRASVPTGTVILEITATAPEPELAATIANSVGNQLTQVVSTLYPARSDGTEAVLATTLSPATAPVAPASPDMKRNIALGFLLGIVLGTSYAVARNALDTKIRTPRDLAGLSEKSLLGSISFDPETSSHPIVMVDRPSSGRAEAMRRLRTNLQFVEVDEGPRTILVTSSVAAEGKTTTALNLAVALADAGSKVLLVDADLRRPSIQRAMGLEGGAGLTSVLIGRANVHDVIQPWRDGRVDVLASGPTPPNPSELLGSAAMSRLLNDLSSQYDVVLVDSPPLLPVTDAAILSKRVDGTILIIGANRATKAQVRTALEGLDAVGARVFGLVLNKISQRDSSGYGSHYEYPYAAEPSSTEGLGVKPEVPNPPRRREHLRMSEKS